MADPVRLRLIGLGYRAAWEITRALPERWAYGIADGLARRSWRKHGPRRTRVEANLRGVVPASAVEHTSREAFRAYARYWVETFRLQDLSRDELARRFRTEGIEIIEKAYAAGSGAVLATMHLGNWDAGGRWVAERWPLVAVAEVLRPRALFDRFLAHRRSLGIDIVPLEKGGDVTARCEEFLREGRLVALVADRDTSGSAVEVEMFGRRTKVPPGPAVLALRTGAALIPAVIYLRPNGEWLAWVMEPLTAEGSADDPAAVANITHRLAGCFERFVRRDPAQWYAMFLQYWLDA